jgi:hypothetical protein
VAVGVAAGVGSLQAALQAALRAALDGDALLLLAPAALQLQLLALATQQTGMQRWITWWALRCASWAWSPSTLQQQAPAWQCPLLPCLPAAPF